MSRYYFSIGQTYARQPHPRLKMTPDDLVYVEAEGYLQARDVFITALGQPWQSLWSSQYEAHEIDSSFDYTFPGSRLPLEDALWPEFPDSCAWVYEPDGPVAA